MNYRRFLMFNVVGGFIWIYLFVYLGFFFGNLPMVRKNFGLVILAIIVVSVLPIVFEGVKAWREKKQVAVGS